MRRPAALRLLAFHTLGTLLLAAASTAQAGPSPGDALPAHLENAIRTLDEQEVRAVLAADVATLERLWSPRILINNPQGGITPDREALLARVREGKIRYSSFERRIEAMCAAGKDLVIVMGSEKVVPAPPAPGAGQAVQRRFTDIWQLKDGAWTLIARHANVIPGAGP